MNVPGKVKRNVVIARWPTGNQEDGVSSRTTIARERPAAHVDNPIDTNCTNYKKGRLLWIE
jgi:hypothetical protein